MCDSARMRKTRSCGSRTIPQWNGALFRPSVRIWDALSDGRKRASFLWTHVEALDGNVMERIGRDLRRELSIIFQSVWKTERC